MKLKIVSLNIWDGGRLFDEMIEFLKQENADVYLLQEVFSGEDAGMERRFRARTEIQKALNLPHAVFAPAYLFVGDEGRIVQGNVIMSRHPLRTVSVNFFDAPYREARARYRPGFPFIPRNVQHAVVRIDGRQLHVLNTQGIWGEDGNDTPRRVAMGKMLAEEVKKVGNAPVVLAGDFNTDPDTVSIRQVEQELRSLFKDELTTSFNVQQKDLEKYPGYAHAVVDMMFVSPDLKVLEHRCPQVNVSDHLPLVAVIEF